MFGERFLAVIHDIWRKNNKSDIVGASLAFIGHDWTWHLVARLATVKNDGHDEGRLVILKLRLLYNYFNNGIRLDALENNQTAMGLPVLKTAGDGGHTFYLSELTLSEAQQEIIVTSNMLVFLKLAEAKPQSEGFYIHDFSIPRAATTATTLTRAACSKVKFSEPAKICIVRTLAQLRTRFPVADVGTALTLLLDPQSKNCVKGLIQDLGQPADTLSVFAVDRLKEEHLRLVKAQTSRHGSSPKPDLETADSDLEDAFQKRIFSTGV
ncbi:hypothetical protein PHMEG_00014850 [Phytophthora megakarya]|uniref:Uncharacterized protein n=1 Tax=Phytophthora megakarya TaxID=4795 RepID=A0A225W2X3_9STRA|nr:hypothetical protein PHMEG_00014850 [Phytophthora megakarya]